MKKFYLTTPNENEQKTNLVSYGTFINRMIENRVYIDLNDLLSIDEYLLDNIVIGNIYDDENDEYIEIYHCYVLLVDHFGTSWDYVNTSIEYTDDINECL